MSFASSSSIDAVVEVEAGLVHASAALGQDPRPRDREAVRRQAELAHQRDVLAVAVVEVARDRAVLAVPNLARRRAEAIPDALAAAVLDRCALDLVRGGRGAPDEAWREGAEWAEGCAGHSEPYKQITIPRALPVRCQVQEVVLSENRFSRSQGVPATVAGDCRKGERMRTNESTARGRRSRTSPSAPASRRGPSRTR